MVVAMHSWLQWLEGQQTLMVALGVFSVVSFVGTLVLVPVLLARMPEDYFVGPHPPAWVTPSGRTWGWGPRIIARVAKSLLGGLLVFLGMSMLVLPGQGILTILLGLALIEFPGKRRLEQRLARRPGVRRSIDWIRERAGRAPLRFDDEAPRLDPPP